MANQSKKINIMSLSIDMDFQERLKKVAKKRNVSVSKLVRDIVEKYLGPEDDTNPVDTIILKIPMDAKSSPQKLQEWLQIRENAIVKALTSC